MNTGTDGNVVFTLLGYISTFIVTLVGAAVTVTWKLSNERRSMDEKVSMLHQSITNTALMLRKEREEQTEMHRRERKAEIDEATRMAGEGIAAVRQKTVETELWVRDNLVRSVDFQIAFQQLTRAVEKIDSKLDRITQNQREDRADRESDHRSGGG